MTSRPYRSPLRERQAEQTRQQIIDALIEMLAEMGSTEVVIRDLAERAGVSERTVYRHFPDRETLLDGVGERLDNRSLWEDFNERVKTLDQYAEALPEVFASFDDRADELRAFLLLDLDARRPSALTRRNQQMALDLVRDAFPDLPADEVAEAAAILHLLGSSRTWQRLRDRDGLSGEAAARAAAFATEAVIEALRRRASDAGNDRPG